jgi:hypothetical protein
VLRGFVPAGRREPLQRRDQGAPEHLAVPLAEFSVRAPEFLQIRHEAVAVLLALLGSGDMAERLEETPALHIHGGREHGPDFGVHGKELRIEVCHCRVSGRLQQPE